MLPDIDLRLQKAVKALLEVVVPVLHLDAGRELAGEVGQLPAQDDAVEDGSDPDQGHHGRIKQGEVRGGRGHPTRGRGATVQPRTQVPGHGVNNLGHQGLGIPEVTGPVGLLLAVAVPTES